MIGDPWMTSRNVSQSLSAYFNFLRQATLVSIIINVSFGGLDLSC